MSSPELNSTHRTSSYNFNSNTNATLKHIDSLGANTTTTTNTNTTSPSLVYHITNNNCQTVNINGLTDAGVNLGRGSVVHREHTQAEPVPNAPNTQQQNYPNEASVTEPAPAVGMLNYPAFSAALAIGAGWMYRAFLGVSGIMDNTTAVEDVTNAQITEEVLDEDEA
ncbi:hypothetical protein PM082_024009 [Marasmius tenuissimus]|nr:hypothetical protein PM082_024009 [Marasmius tenuissimus]